jgi:catechol 2,3-dioxygenase
VKGLFPGGAKWTGTPRGTTKGHVHLHGGSLDQAEAFYHRALGLDKTADAAPVRV